MEGNRCVHYDIETARCLMHAARPRICRTFPTELRYHRERGAFTATYSVLCSLVDAYGFAARAGPGGAAAPGRSLPLYDPRPRWRRARIADLDAADIEQIEAYAARLREELETLYVLARAPRRLDALGLARFRHPDD